MFGVRDRRPPRPAALALRLPRGLDIGTAPEIARRLTTTYPHTHVTLDPAAETYSLGVSLCYAWTGALPGLEHDLRIGETTAPAPGNIATGRHLRPLADERPRPTRRSKPSSKQP